MQPPIKTKVKKEDVQAIYPLNMTQQSLLFHSLQWNKQDPGFLQVRFTLRGKLNRNSIVTAWQRAIERHEALRMSVHTPKNQQPMLVVSKNCHPKWSWASIKELDSVQKTQRLNSFCETDRAEKIDLSDPPVIRLAAFETKTDEHMFVWSCHHLFLDGWSATSILKDVMQLYDAEEGQAEPDLKPLSSYRDYLGWLKQHSSEKAEEFWKDQLNGFYSPVSLAALLKDNRQRPDSSPPLANEHQTISKTLSSETMRAIDDSQNHHTAATIFFASWYVTLSLIGRTNDIVFGTTCSGRFFDLRGRDSMAGCFANVIPKRSVLSDAEPLTELLTNVNQSNFASLAYEHFPLGEIQKLIATEGFPPLFESLLIYENLPWNDLENESGLQLCNYQGGLTTTYPFTLVVKPNPEWKIECRVKPEICPSKAEQVLSAFVEIVDQVSSNPHQTLSDLKNRLKQQFSGLASSAKLESANPPEQVENVTARNQSELAVAKLWEQVLGITNIDVNTNFLDLGGRSIAAVRILTLMADQLGKRISLADFVQAPTIAAIAKRMNDDSETIVQWKSLVPIKPNGSKPPVFCVHAGGGHVLFLHELARHVEKEQPVFGLQPIGLDGTEQPLTSFEAIAAHYIDELKTLQPQGPYYLIGNCHGSRVSFEMAQQLQRSGEQVAMLVVLDAIPPVLSKRVSSADATKQKASEHLNNLMAGRWLIAARAVKSLVVARTKFRWNWLRESIRQKWVPKFGSSFARQQLKLDQVQAVCERADKKYVAEHYPGKVTLIRAADRPNLVLDWGVLCDEFERIKLPVGHYTLFKEPDVQVLAAAINRTISESQRRAGAESTEPIVKKANDNR